MNETISPNSNTAPAVVCVLTGRGPAAIAGIGLVGSKAKAIAERLFSQAVPACGQSAVGTIRDGQTVIDSVVAGCEGPGRYVFHCHGNPLLVERIVRLCERFGAAPQPAEAYLFAQLQHETDSLIEAEARLEMTRAATLEGVKLIAGQITNGLTAWARRWIEDKSFDINELHEQCRRIIEQSGIAERILRGVRIALVGPPNSGKSTLLNWLAADKTAIVSNTAGTTRDWVAATCRIGPLRAEVIDTAGLDRALADSSELDRAAQDAAFQAAATSDLILNVRDCTCPKTEVHSFLPRIPVLNVLTKIDLLADPSTFQPGSGIPVSVQTDCGMEELYARILAILDVDNLVFDRPIAFTARQQICLKRLAESPAAPAARKALTELVGRIRKQKNCPHQQK